MSDTALNINPSDPASVSGLDDLFESGNALGTAQKQQAIPGTAEGTASSVPVEQAAKLLGISQNAVIKRLNKGKLSGFKTTGQYGPKWMVHTSELPSEAIHIEFEALEAQPTQPLEEPGNASGTAQTRQAVPGTAEGFASDSIKLLAEVIQTQSAQIQAQNDLIKHLTSEIKDRDSQVKLLTDKQQNKGWWARFASWFVGAR